jgi:hypothetical protein
MVTLRQSRSRRYCTGSLVEVRHCEPTGRRKVPPDDRLREAIHNSTKGLYCLATSRWRTSALVRIPDSNLTSRRVR